MCSEYKYDGASLTELAKASFGGGGVNIILTVFFFVCLFCPLLAILVLRGNMVVYLKHNLSS